MKYTLNNFWRDIRDIATNPITLPVLATTGLVALAGCGGERNVKVNHSGDPQINDYLPLVLGIKNDVLPYLLIPRFGQDGSLDTTGMRAKLDTLARLGDVKTVDETSLILLALSAYHPLDSKVIEKLLHAEVSSDTSQMIYEALNNWSGLHNGAVMARARNSVQK